MNMYKIIALGVLMGLLTMIAACRSKNTRKVPVKQHMRQELQVGALAPDFSLPDEAGVIHSLSEMKGSNLALYFYPKDQTPGCTAQACSLRDGIDDLKSAGVQVWGINYDSPESHQKFKEKYRLNFTLLSDEAKEVSRLYGVSGWLVPGRVTFLIDKAGRIVKVLKHVDVRDHAQEIIREFAKAAR